MFGEHATKEFWEYVFQKLVFFERKYMVSSEQPPETYGTQRSVDLVVKEGTQKGFPVILWREDKRGAASVGGIVEVESQGYTAGLEYLNSVISTSSDREAVWVMTGYGPHSRLWVYLKEDQTGLLEPIWPRDHSHGDRHMYIDFMDHEMEYQWMFSLIKGNPFPNTELIHNYINSRASILVDCTIHHQIQVIKVKEHEYVECRLQNNAIVKLPSEWILPGSYGTISFDVAIILLQTMGKSIGFGNFLRTLDVVCGGSSQEPYNPIVTSSGNMKQGWWSQGWVRTQ